jgi:hypothetical protein
LSEADKVRAYNQAILMVAQDIRARAKLNTEAATTGPTRPTPDASSVSVEVESPAPSHAPHTPERGALNEIKEHISEPGTGASPQVLEKTGMDREQRVAVAIGIGATVLLALVPPWHFTVRGLSESCGYGLCG